MKVYQLLARALTQVELGPLFGVTGDANVYLIDCSCASTPVPLLRRRMNAARR